MIRRENETKKLLELCRHEQADLVAIYGRRRVGKTFLVDQTFHGDYLFMSSGLFLDKEKMTPKEMLSAQIKEFYNALRLYGYKEGKAPETWSEAFFCLEKLILMKENGSKQVIFLDELPWVDTPSSHFLSAFEGFWNGFACRRKSLLIIVCGSAASWMENKLIHARVGLYGRVTYEMKLSPFSLKETKEFLLQKRLPVTDYDAALAYMSVGGIPYYLNYFEPGKSVVQNINDIFFRKRAPLRYEYERLFSVTFASDSLSKRIVELLFQRKLGCSREEILKKHSLPDNGGLSKVLNALLSSDFILAYHPFGLKRKTTYYKLIDPFCLFHLSFAEKKDGDEDYWNSHYGKSETLAWSGLAYENLCFNHVSQIKEKLGIRGVATEVMPWYYQDKEGKGQVDMLLKRGDNAVNLCEIKFYSGDYPAGIEDFKKASRRKESAYSLLPKRFSVYITLITTFGLVYNEYASVYQNAVTLEDLCKL